MQYWGSLGLSFLIAGVTEQSLKSNEVKCFIKDHILNIANIACFLMIANTALTQEEKSVNFCVSISVTVRNRKDGNYLATDLSEHIVNGS